MENNFQFFTLEDATYIFCSGFHFGICIFSSSGFPSETNIFSFSDFPNAIIFFL